MKLRTKEAMCSQLQRTQRPHRQEQYSRHGQTLVEGPQAVCELLIYAPGLTCDLYVAEETIERHDDVTELAPTAGVWTHVLAAQNMRDLSADAQGMVAAISTSEAPGLNSFLGEASLAMTILDIADPGSLETIIRTTDTVGIDVVATSGMSTELYSPKVMRSTAGSHFHVPYVAEAEASEFAAWAQEAGLQVLTAEGTRERGLPVLVQGAAEAKILGAVPNRPNLRYRALWFVGNKAHGFAGCDFDVDTRVAVPLYGKAESLNVSTILAVCAYASAMAQRTGRKRAD